MTQTPGVAGVSAVVLAAGAASQFGGVKLLAELGGRPVLQHVLDAVEAQGLGEVVVVLGDDAEAMERAIAWRGERRVRNPDPGRGLASSLSVGLDAVSPTATGGVNRSWRSAWTSAPTRSGRSSRNRTIRRDLLSCPATMTTPHGTRS